jgi:FKBP-type peptidyl-prolyl cis-trans isomerase
MIKKYVFLVFTVCAAVLLSSCGKDDDEDVIDEAWKTENEQAFNAKTFDPSFTRHTALNNAGVVYYKQTKPGNGKPIYYTSRVEVYYEGSLINGVVFDKNDPQYGAPFKVAFSSDMVSKYPTYSGVISGWTTILQFMTEGEEGEVWIPQELGYGSVARGTDIPAYSTLIFKLQVSKVLGIDEP